MGIAQHCERPVFYLLQVKFKLEVLAYSNGRGKAIYKIAMLHRLSVLLLFGKELFYTKGEADPTFASAKVKNAIGRIGIFYLVFHFYPCVAAAVLFIYNIEMYAFVIKYLKTVTGN